MRLGHTLAGLLALVALVAAGPAVAQRGGSDQNPAGYQYGVPHAPGVHDGVSGPGVPQQPGVHGNEPRGGYLVAPFFYGDPYGYGAYGYGYGYSPYNALPSQPMTSCTGTNCAYQAFASYGACYSGLGGIAQHALVNWQCRRYDGLIVAPGLCQPPPNVTACQ